MIDHLSNWSSSKTFWFLKYFDLVDFIIRPIHYIFLATLDNLGSRLHSRVKRSVRVFRRKGEEDDDQRLALFWQINTQKSEHNCCWDWRIIVLHCWIEWLETESKFILAACYMQTTISFEPTTCLWDYVSRSQSKMLRTLWLLLFWWNQHLRIFHS